MPDLRDRWELYDRPGLLIGPLPYRRTPSGYWAPDYRHPGVKERVAAEVNYVCDMDDERRR